MLDRSFDLRPLTFLAVLALAGCEGSPSSPPPPIAPGSRGLEATQAGAEEEIFGFVWVDDVPVSPDSVFHVQLDPSPEAQAALDAIPGLEFSDTIFVDGALDGNEWGWFVWGANREECTGGPDDQEVHRALGSGTEDPFLPTGPERHCVVPGRYTITLLEGPEGAGTPVPGTAHEIDFITGETTTLDGSTVLLENPALGIEKFVDNVVNFDIAAP